MKFSFGGHSGLALAVAMACSSPAQTMAGWNAGRVHHVDAVGNAHLFRGAAPVTDGTTFVFDDMRTTLQQVGNTSAVSVGGCTDVMSFCTCLSVVHHCGLTDFSHFVHLCQ